MSMLQTYIILTLSKEKLRQLLKVTETVIKDSVQLNFQANLNQRQLHHNFIKMQNYSVGNNILLNRLCSLNNEIPKTMTDDSYNTFKVKCKKQFLKTVL